ncbi:MAG: methyltransferase domain-containing protein [bacterium]|nr:methyltransferase domain-containing protein [bacterium]
MKVNVEEIKKWMDEKYKFWRTSFPYYQNKQDNFWQLHPISELPKRVQYLQILSKYVNEPTSTTIVDVGIAGGMFPFLLHKLGLNVIGLDWGGISSQEELEKMHPGVKVYACHYEKEKWPLDNSVDVVTHLDVIEHVHPPQQFMFQEIMRILKPGGILIVSTPNLASLRKRIWLLRGKHPVGQLKEFFESNPFVEHIREFTVNEVSQIVKWAGFEVISAYCINHIYYTRYAEASTAMKKIILKIYNLLTLLKNDLKDTIVVEARKPI